MTSPITPRLALRREEGEQVRDFPAKTSFLDTAREIVGSDYGSSRAKAVPCGQVAPRAERVTHDELKILAGMVYGRQVDQADLRVTEAFCAYRKAQRGKGFLDLVTARARVRYAIVRARALRLRIVAEYGRHLPAIRRGLAMRGEAA